MTSKADTTLQHFFIEIEPREEGRLAAVARRRVVDDRGRGFLAAGTACELSPLFGELLVVRKDKREALVKARAVWAHDHGFEARLSLGRESSDDGPERLDPCLWEFEKVAWFPPNYLDRSGALVKLAWITLKGATVQRRALDAQVMDGGLDTIDVQTMPAHAKLVNAVVDTHRRLAQGFDDKGRLRRVRFEPAIVDEWALAVEAWEDEYVEWDLSF